MFSLFCRDLKQRVFARLICLTTHPHLHLPAISFPPQVPKTDEGLEAVIFTAQGDMRQVQRVRERERERASIQRDLNFAVARVPTTNMSAIPLTFIPHPFPFRLLIICRRRSLGSAQSAAKTCSRCVNAEGSFFIYQFMLRTFPPTHPLLFCL